MRHFHHFHLTACLILSVVVAASTFSAQEKKISKKDVPAVILSAFANAYPHAQIKGTLTEVENGTTYYEIESLDGKQARDLLYLADGTISEIEEVVASGMLPAPVIAAMRNEFAEAKIAKAEKVTKGKDVSYEIHVTSGAKKGSAVVDAFGKILKKKSLHSKEAKREKEEADEEEVK